MTTPAVELRNVSKRFGDFTAVEDLSLSIPTGSFFCLLGSSGSGKSTALRMVAGLESTTQGSIYLNGMDVTQVPPHRRRVNTVFQSYALFPGMTLFDNVAYGLRAAGVKRSEITKRVEDALGMVRMAEQATKKASQLSGGQQQRVALARAMVNEPDVLLLDEPLGALDLRLRRDMQEELVGLHARTGTTFVHVTHDQEEAFACATHIGVMSEGRLQQVGTADEIYRRPKSAFIAGFVGSANLIPAVVTGRHGSHLRVSSVLGDAIAGSHEEWSIDDDATLVVRPEDLYSIRPLEGVE